MTNTALILPPPTDEQLAVIAATKVPASNLMITAFAGVGKTTTLVMLAKEIRNVPVLALAFNKKIQLELEKKFPSNFKVQTMNGLGHGAWAKAIGKRLILDTDKLGKIYKSVVKDMQLQDSLDKDKFGEILSIVRAARGSGLIPARWEQESGHTGLVPDTREGWEQVLDTLYLEWDDQSVALAKEILSRSIRLAYEGEIDFDDQIYMSALFGGVFPRFPVVLVDEAQDLSPLNHIQLRKVAVGRLIVCGDPRQAIYAFRGADSYSMENLRSLRDSWVDLPLSLTFRCPRDVVVRQQHHAHGYRAAEQNLQGRVLDYRQGGEPSDEHPNGVGRAWSMSEIQALDPGHIAILCRNNAPLFSCALRLLKSGYGVNLLGNDIAKGLITLVRKLFPSLELPVEEAIVVIKEWMDNETSKARANGKDAKVAIIRDRGECLLAVCEHGEIRTAGGIISRLNSMFDKTSLRITLATGHKAKGQEWPVVVHLDPFRVPSRFAIRAAEAGYNVPMEQDLNLKYVIETRTKDVLVLANLDALTDGQT